jgi:UDP-GlcNAc:undecaprenyl-phosphate/decaprenyl-phosphate GlcNAc-1-phosphate transferase
LNYLGILILNIVTVSLYYRFASRFDIVDRPNERSSHNYTTIRGVGVIFLITGLYWTFINLNQHLYFAIGLLTIGVVSLLDDIFSLNNKVRILIQLLAVILALTSLQLLEVKVSVLILIVILYIGWMNAFNFMDGINGITAAYTISILVPIYYAGQVYSLHYSSLIIYIGISLSVFMFLNLREQAIAFCGDVGSVVLAYIIAFITIQLIISSGKIQFIMFGSVYGVDSIFTIIRRLLKSENIFLPHRTHLYQLLSNELGWNFLRISLIYSSLQLFISLIIFLSIQMVPQYSTIISLIIIFVLSAIYFLSLKKLTFNLTKNN